METFKGGWNILCIMVWPWAYGDQWVECGSLEIYMHLNIWSQVGGTSLEGLRDVVLLENMCHWKAGFEIPKAYLIPT